ncbi:diguanylate cyclase domain-containing protein [Alkalilimnicola ehrlichii MLHE-1]|uniref:Diguanylate cyclase with PAS/PAC sensor n=1 Tax=Alkalilimnicola ehrlichii (strain ATCC BAA-1101 / DSM 17681 / MLHE-1) TaxID=187272 RepID=Q0A873_ALKEH|nr:sensor domain-containing diguanylate cyclase [Alkalilimnicola ehrlichii]ABI56964.1 diguanylate cyclase with PAS/PAC sensor [Alkalilimnicola ehrlichii MLHE-1]
MQIKQTPATPSGRSVAGTLCGGAARRWLSVHEHQGPDPEPGDSELFRNIVRYSSDAIVVIDEAGTVRYANPAAGRLFGRAVNALVGRPFALSLGGKRAEVDIVRPKGDLVVAEMHTARIPWGDQVAQLAILRDITEWRETLSRLDHLARFDALTDLPNRSELQRQLRKALARASRRSAPLAVLFLDLDGFKVVNDTLGHSAGDRLLREVAIRLHAATRTGDLLARIGGDEFVLVLEDFHCAEDAGQVARKLIRTLERPFKLDGTELRLGASIGIARYPDDGSGPAELVRAADHAMYRAKAGGRGTYRYANAPHED